MRNKTEAAKILLEKGWTFEEVLGVLGESQNIIINPSPYPVPYPVYPSQPYWWIDYTYRPTITTGNVEITS